MQNQITANFAQVPLGETIVYHRGMIASDRVYNEALDETAKLAMNLSTACWWDKQRFCMQRGTGEFELKQNRIAPFCYEYLAKRIRLRPS